MSVQEQTEKMVKMLDHLRPGDFFKKLDETNKGILAVLRFLYEADEEVTAGQISTFMNVSTARVAVLLKKMEAKGLIIKEIGRNDARTTVVKLSDFGREKTEELRANLYRQVETVIEQIGIERLTQFIDTAREIRAVLQEPSLEIEEKKQD